MAQQRSEHAHGCHKALIDGTCYCFSQPLDYRNSCEHFVPAPHAEGVVTQQPSVEPQLPRLRCVNDGGLLLRTDAPGVHQDVQLTGEQALRLALSLLSETLAVE